MVKKERFSFNTVCEWKLLLFTSIGNMHRKIKCKYCILECEMVYLSFKANLWFHTNCVCRVKQTECEP